MIDFYYSIALLFVAGSSKRASFAIRCFVSGDGLFVSAFVALPMAADVLHVLPHKTNYIILLLIIVQLVGSKAATRALLLLIKIIVFDICGYTLLLQ